MLASAPQFVRSAACVAILLVTPCLVHARGVSGGRGGFHGAPHVQGGFAHQGFSHQGISPLHSQSQQFSAPRNDSSQYRRSNRLHRTFHYSSHGTGSPATATRSHRSTASHPAHGFAHSHKSGQSTALGTRKFGLDPLGKNSATKHGSSWNHSHGHHHLGHSATASRRARHQYHPGGVQTWNGGYVWGWDTNNGELPVAVEQPSSIDPLYFDAEYEEPEMTPEPDTPVEVFIEPEQTDEE